MRTLKLFSFVIILILPFSLYSQEKRDSVLKIKNIQYGMSVNLLSFSRFYNDRNKTKYNFSNSKLFNLNLDFVVFYHIKKKYYFTTNLSYLPKSSISKGGLPYNFQYLTLAPMISKKFKHWQDGDFVLSVGPYIGYLLKAKKGKFNFIDSELKKWEFGVEFLYSTDIESNFVPTNFTTLKFQLGLTEILYFKSATFTISFVGFSF